MYLKKTDLFKTVLPSKIFEAGGMEKPVIIGVKGYAAEIVKKAKLGVEIESEDDKQLVNALMEFRENPEAMRSCGRDGREYITEKYNRDDLAMRYIHILDLLTSSGKTATAG